jgi:hypothetical protein
MANKRRTSDALNVLREAAIEQLGDEPSVDSEVDESEPVEEKIRKPKVVDAAVAALFPAGIQVIHEMILAASKTWREATEREAPSIEKLSMAGVIERIDVDGASGYVSVVTEEDTWRAFLPREQLSIIVALMLRKPIEEVARVMAEGPGPIKPAQETHKPHHDEPTVGGHSDDDPVNQPSEN